jgi:hypothetical protein
VRLPAVAASLRSFFVSSLIVPLPRPVGRQNSGVFFIALVRCSVRAYVRCAEDEQMDAYTRQKEVVRALWEMCSEMHRLADNAARRNEILEIAARYAWALYHDLEGHNRVALPSAELKKRREPWLPKDPDFFDCPEAVEELAEKAWEALSP